MKNLLVLFFLVFFTASARSEGPEVVLKSGIYSEYENKAGILLYDGWLSINSLTVTNRDVYFDVTTFTGLERRASLGDFGDEIDLGLGLKHKYDWLKVDGRLSYYMLRNLSHSDDDRWIFDLRTDFTKIPIVQPYLAARYFGAITSKIPEGGWFGFIGVRREQPLDFLPGLSGKKIKLIWDAHIACTDGAIHRSPGWVYARAGGSLEIPISKKIKISPSLFIQIPAKANKDRHPSYTTKEVEVIGAISWEYHF